jgi:hypothetical protein
MIQQVLAKHRVANQALLRNVSDSSSKEDESELQQQPFLKQRLVSDSQSSPVLPVDPVTEPPTTQLCEQVHSSAKVVPVPTAIVPYSSALERIPDEDKAMYLEAQKTFLLVEKNLAPRPSLQKCENPT